MERDGGPAPAGAGLGDLLTGLGRGVGGALLLGLPMLMTMELWQLGFSIDRWRLVLLLVLAFPLLVGVSHRMGFERTFGWRDDVRDSFIALGIGLVTAAAILALFHEIGLETPASEVAGKLGIEAVPGALGALLAKSQLGAEHPDEEGGQALSGYFGTLFLMLVGALFFSLNIAPTDEVVVIAYDMRPWHAILLVIASLAVMHGFVFAVGFRGGVEAERGTPWWSNLLRFTLPGYVLALVISLLVLWIFGRTDGLGLAPITATVVVLGFPAAVGAAAARLIL